MFWLWRCTSYLVTTVFVQQPLAEQAGLLNMAIKLGAFFVNIKAYWLHSILSDSSTTSHVYFWWEYRSVQCSAVQYSAVQFSAVQCSTVQCSTVQASSFPKPPLLQESRLSGSGSPKPVDLVEWKLGAEQIFFHFTNDCTLVLYAPLIQTGSVLMLIPFSTMLGLTL